VGRDTTERHVLSIQTILLTSSLLIVLGMVASLMALAALRVRAERAGIQVETPDERL
jgi:hypothetical protein